VVECLSSVVRNDTLLDNKHRISGLCREQLTFELLQRVSIAMIVLLVVVVVVVINNDNNNNNREFSIC